MGICITMSVMKNKGEYDVPLESSMLDRKLDPRGRRSLSKGEIAGDVELMVRTDTEVTPTEQQTLREAGLDIHFVTGNVLSGSLPAEQLTSIAELPFVRRIELSRALFPEDD